MSGGTCPFTRLTGQAGSGCKDTCALWSVTSPGTENVAPTGACVFQILADMAGFIVDELHGILHPEEVEREKRLYGREPEDDLIVLCPGCGKVRQPDDTWKMPKMGPKRDTFRPETCPECEVKDNDGE